MKFQNYSEFQRRETRGASFESSVAAEGTSCAREETTTTAAEDRIVARIIVIPRAQSDTDKDDLLLPDVPRVL